jgi:predicted alpha/beta superfamily hydrolase
VQSKSIRLQYYRYFMNNKPVSWRPVIQWLLSLLLYGVFAGCNGKLSQDVIDTNTTHFTWHSTYVKDSFDVYISLPDGYDTSTVAYPVIYYMDANLKSGKEIRKAIYSSRQKGKALNAISIGIGHFGNYRELRRRDLITPFVKTAGDSLISDDNNFGHCEEFYRFLQYELIPFVEKQYRCNSTRSWVGHSLGGLFAFYCLFKKQPLFTNYVALSPALWINYSNIYDFEEKYRKQSDTLNATVYLCAGSWERLNKILTSARQMKALLDKRKYTGLHLVYREYEGETHNSEVPVALDEILPVLGRPEVGGRKILMSLKKKPVISFETTGF